MFGGGTTAKAPAAEPEIVCWFWNVRMRGFCITSITLPSSLGFNALADPPMTGAATEAAILREGAST